MPFTHHTVQRVRSGVTAVPPWQLRLWAAAAQFWHEHFIPCCPEWTAWKLLDIVWLLLLVKLGQRLR